MSLGTFQAPRCGGASCCGPTPPRRAPPTLAPGGRSGVAFPQQLCPCSDMPLPYAMHHSISLLCTLESMLPAKLAAVLLCSALYNNFQRPGCESLSVQRAFLQPELLARLLSFLFCCSAVVRGRDPLGKDPDLDYEVMSDEEWEDEPEGENLSVSVPFYGWSKCLERNISASAQVNNPRWGPAVIGAKLILAGGTEA